LRTLSIQDRHSGDDVAQMLSIVGGLNRCLKADGITFQEMLDEVRFSVAGGAAAARAQSRRQNNAQQHCVAAAKAAPLVVAGELRQGTRSVCGGSRCTVKQGV
jgi:hypothetical protein